MTTLRFDTYQREAKVAPLDIDLGDAVVTIPVPNGQQFMDAEEAGSTRRALRIVCGPAAWEKLEPFVGRIEDPQALRDFVRDVMGHFRMSGEDAPNAGGPR